MEELANAWPPSLGLLRSKSSDPPFARPCKGTANSVARNACGTLVMVGLIRSTGPMIALSQNLDYDPVQAGDWMAWQGVIRPFEASL